MPKDKRWTQTVKLTLTPIKFLISNMSVKTRTDQYLLFKKLICPTKKDKVLDVGVTSTELLKDSNMFEKLYSPQENITAATIEDPILFKKLYPKVKVRKIYPGKNLPFKDKEFEVVVAWATLEHVGDYLDQEFFLNELLRVGKKVFVTTPYRGCIYEPHTGIFFMHWLPLAWFRRIINLMGQKFWTTSRNLNPLYPRDIKKMNLKRKVNIKIFRMFNFFPSHLIISSC